MRDLNLSLLSRTSLVGSTEAGSVFLGHVEALHAGWLPERWGHEEPLRHRSDGGPIDDMFGADLLWRGRDGSMGDASVSTEPWQPHAYLTIEAELARADMAGATGLLKRLAAEFKGDYGFIHQLTLDDASFLAGSQTTADFHEDGPFLVVPSEQLQLCLPHLFWVNVLGPPYTELFGADRLASAPAHTVEEVAPGTFYLQLSERIQDLHEHPAQIEDARIEIREHLGVNAFWHPQAGPDFAHYEAPRFPTEEERLEPADHGAG